MMTLHFLCRGGFALAAAAVMTGCSAQTPASPSSAASSAVIAGAGVSAEASRPASRCVYVSYDGVAALGFPLRFPGPLGALPGPATIGDIHGTLWSYITGADVSGSRGQGAAHYTLKHTFTSSVGQFETEDRAVCGVAGKDPLVCRVNDVLRRSPREPACSPTPMASSPIMGRSI